MKSNTINKQEIAKFSKIATEWWNPEGKFKKRDFSGFDYE